MRLAGTIGLILIATACLGLALGIAAPPKDTIQFRVVGASNSIQAQTVKLAVRDAVLARIAPGLRGERTAQAATAYLRRELPAIRDAAAAVAGPAGERVVVRLGSQPVPAHQLGFVSFPARPAPALVVTLGAGRGHNWWTVLFPPLTLVTVDHQLMVVGPTGGSAVPVHHLSPRERSLLLAQVAKSPQQRLRLGVDVTGTGGLVGADVQIRFALWDAVRRIPLDTLNRRVLAWWDAL